MAPAADAGAVQKLEIANPATALKRSVRVTIEKIIAPPSPRLLTKR
ncbi:hypothetical protein MESS2_740002 [Mesorhizobium metallidurans STM 2683]|uniref:Uncharacterized protein n=1 Tax=Mesorhizobium metallidurans STM 2683 TaxID=1297569 RepID=M5EWP1_9HYPH|nr:hypothetical protein MESS2_740002 [Mesorhizobium metallidurans STM 2683]